MPVYARSDVMYVTVGRKHGGCGEPHARPVVNGAPARSWKLDCPQCQSHLAHDPLWSGTMADVPSTPDEDLARDNVEKSTARSREDIMALALAKIAGLPVAEYLSGMLGNAVDTGTVSCPDGHENFPSSKFCGECGARMNADVTGEVVSKPLPAKRATPATRSVSQQRRIAAK